MLLWDIIKAFKYFDNLFDRFDSSRYSNSNPPQRIFQLIFLSAWMRITRYDGGSTWESHICSTRHFITRGLLTQPDWWWVSCSGAEKRRCRGRPSREKETPLRDKNQFLEFGPALINTFPEPLANEAMNKWESQADRRQQLGQLGGGLVRSLLKVSQQQQKKKLNNP